MAVWCVVIVSVDVVNVSIGTANLSNATGNVCLVRIALTSGQSITALSIGVAA